MPAEALRVEANGAVFRVLTRGSGPPLLLLHGFTGSADAWMPLLPKFASRFRVYAIDLIGHGGSTTSADEVHYTFHQANADLVAVANMLGIGQAIWLGYSLGGRLALGVALQHPESVSTLILESATPGIRGHAERAARRAADEALARRIEERGIESFVAEWESLPMWDSQHSLEPEIRAAQRARRLANNPAGLARSLRGMGQGAQPSHWDRLAELRAPALLIAGALDDKFAAIAAEMSQKIPRNVLAVVPDAGHAVHLERPMEYVSIVQTFLARGGSPPLAPKLEVVR